MVAAGYLALPEKFACLYRWGDNIHLRFIFVRDASELYFIQDCVLLEYYETTQLWGHVECEDLSDGEVSAESDDMRKAAVDLAKERKNFVLNPSHSTNWILQCARFFTIASVVHRCMQASQSSTPPYLNTLAGTVVPGSCLNIYTSGCRLFAISLNSIQTVRRRRNWARPLLIHPNCTEEFPTWLRTCVQLMPDKLGIQSSVSSMSIAQLR